MPHQPCFECDTLADVHHHHVVPRSLGGTRTVPLCPACHAKVHQNAALITSKVLTKAALSVKKARGDALGNAPYGFRFSDDGQTFVEDPPEQATLTQVRALRAEGRTVRTTLEEATQRGLRSRTGKAFTLAALHKMSAA